MSNNFVDIKKLKSLAKEIRESWTYDKDKTKEMKELTDILKDINSKSSIEQYFNNNKNEINYFINNFIDIIVPTILSQSYVIGRDGDDIALDLLFQIYRLFATFHKKNYTPIFENIIKIFKDPENNAFFFPQNKINKPGTISNFKKRYNFTKFNTEFCSEFKKNESLKIFPIGDKVDILIDYKDSRTDIDKTAWVRGIIKKIENDLYYIEYNGEETEITFHIGSPKVQPEGTKTSDWDWRINLKKYDLVDVYDRETWYPCTICDVIEKTDKNGIKRVKYKIGFRLYINHFKNVDEPNDSFINHTSFWTNINAHSDNHGEEYIGDDEEKDEEIFHFSQRIQHFNTYSDIQRQSKEGGDENILINIKEDFANKDIISEEINLKDLYFYEKNNKKNIIIGNSDNFSYYFACLLKKMENEGDFDKFIDIITNNPNKEELLTIFTIYYNSLNYIHSQYFENNKGIIKKEFLNYLEYYDDKEIKDLTNNLIDLGKKLLHRLYEKDNPKENISIEEDINLKVTFKKIKTSNFEKRLNGIKSLKEFINKNLNNEKLLKKIFKEIKNNKIFDEIFGANYHSQIISKSAEIVKLLLKYKITDENDIQLIWSSTQKGDSEVKKIIINLLIDLIPNFDDVFIGNLLNAMIAVSDGKPDEKETDLAYRLSLQTKSQENKMKICKYFSRSLFELSTFSSKNPVFSKLIQLINYDENYLIKFLEICEDNYKHNKHTLICNSLIVELFNNFISFKPNQEPPYQCSKESINKFLKDEHLIKIFEDNFSNYMNIVKEKLKSPNINTIEKIFIDGFNHKNNIDGRLAFLLNIIIKIYPNYDFIFKLKELLIDNPAVKEDKEHFYNFIERYCFNLRNQNVKNKIREQAKIKLFYIFAKNDQTEMNYFQFNLFIKTFFYLNKDQLDYQIIQKSNDEYDYNINLKENINYDEIKEINILWKMIFEVKEEIVLNKLINVIYQMVHDESIIIKNIDPDNEKDRNAEKIQKCYKLLNLFFIESEKNAVIDIKSYHSLLKNAIIKLPLELSNENYNKNNTIELFYDNTSINEIKEVLMKKYKIPMEYIETYIEKDNHIIKLDYTYNNKTLKEIIIDDLNKKNEIKNIQFNKIIRFTKKKINIKDLITNNNELSPKFKNIIKEWYKDFTKESIVMNRQIFASLMSKLTNSKIKESDFIVKEAFNKYDTADNGFLTQDNFYEFYLGYILEYNNFIIVLENLKNMGYDEYLCKIDETLEVKHIGYDNLLRYRISGEDFINEFIEHYNTYPEIDYDFIFYLPTNIDIYKEILFNFNSNDSNLFDDVFGNEENILKQLYYLIIIESILQDIELQNLDIKRIFKNPNNSIQKLCSNKYEPFDSIEIEKKIQFIEDFIKNKNYDKLIKYNIDMLNKYKRNHNELIKKCFRKGLNIFRIIFESFLDYNLENIYNTLTEDNIYYLDYSHINKVFKDKNDIKEKINNYSFSNIFKAIMNYLLNNNNIDELYHDCFDMIIKFLAFNDKLLDEFISDEKIKKKFYDLIISNISSNYLAIIKSLTDTFKKLSYISNSSDKFISFFNEIMDSIFNSENNKIFLSNEFFIFCTEIMDSLYITEKYLNNKLLLNIINMLVNNINEKDKEKKIKKEIFIKYIELLIRLIEKNSKIRQILLSYIVNNETLSSILTEKIILGEFDSKENNKKKTGSKNNISNDNKNFILIGKNEDDEDDESINDKLKQTCLNYILSCLKDKNDINTKREIIKLNKIRKDIEKNDLSDNTHNNKNNNNSIITNQNKKNLNDYIKNLKVFNHVGLRNLGSTCYMNSIIQQLYMIPTFRYAIMGANDNDSINPVLRYGEQDDNLLHQLQVVFSYLNLSEKQYFIPTYFCKSLKDIDGNPTNPKIQQDSLEFFINFCDKIEKLLENTKYKYIINDIFMGKTCSSVICDSCHHISNTFENICHLSLEVKNINNLNDSLQKLIVPETVEGYKCDGCKKNVTIQKITSLCKLPNILFIQLKRFYMDYDTFQTQKINSRFEFPLKINLKNFCIEKIQQQNENESDNIYFKKDEYYEYKLKGVNVHIGQAYGGHYISFIDINRDGKGNNLRELNKNEIPNWLNFNDSNITQYNLNDIPSDCYGGNIINRNLSSTQTAYLLIYERVNKTPIKVLIDKNNISADMKNKVIEFQKYEEEFINKKYDISKLNNNINEEELYKMIFHNKDNNEYYQITQFYKIPKYAPKFLYNKIKYENKLLLKENIKQDNNSSDIKFGNKIRDLFNDAFINGKNNKQIKEDFNIDELNDILHITLFDIFRKAKKTDLTDEEINDINNDMKKIIKNIIEPLTYENMNPSILETMQKNFTDSNNLEIIFESHNRIFRDNVIKDIYDYICNLNKILNSRNPLAVNIVFINLIDYLKKIKTSPDYKGSNEFHPIKYIYSIIIDLMKENNELQIKCVKENLINILIEGIENEFPQNQINIFTILKILIKATKDYNKTLFYLPKEVDENKPVIIKDKEQIKTEILKNNINELIFDKDSDLLFILIKVLQYEDKDFSDKFNIICLPSLLDFSINNQKLITFIELCYNIIDIKDGICLRRMKQVLGFPTMIINPKLNKQNKKQKWPIFGAELIKNNNNDLKTEIYKYTCFYKKKPFCVLSYLLPYSGDIKHNKGILTHNNIKELVKILLLKCLFRPTNYSIFKYLYLLPARSLYYKNVYEELKDIIKDDSSYDFKTTNQIEEVFIQKINYELNEMYIKRYPNNKNVKLKKIEKPVLPTDIVQYIPNLIIIEEFLGFNPDYIPGEIVKEEIETIVNTRYLKLIRIEYLTTYYEIDDLKKIINENKEINLDNKKENENNNNDSNEKLDKKNKTITVDISNMEYQKDENKLIFDISNKLGDEVNKFIIEDRTIQFDNDVINSLIRYILVNKKPINNRMRAQIYLNNELNIHIKDNVCIPEYLIDYVDKHNYVDFLDINRIKKDEKFLEKDDIFIRIDSKAYINKK